MEPQNQNVSSVSGLTLPGALFKTAWNLYKSNWMLLSGIAVVPAVITILSQLCNLSGGGLVAVGAVLSLLSFIVNLVMQPTLIITVDQLSRGERGLSVWPQFRRGFSFFWPFVLVVILVVLVSIGSIGLFVVPGIIVGLYISLYVFAVVLDGKRGYEALTESYQLVYGRWLAVIGRQLYLALMFIGFMIVIAIVGIIISVVLVSSVATTGAMIAPTTAVHASPVQTIIGLVFGLIVNGIIVPIFLSYTYGLYMSLKATRPVNVATATFKKWLVAFTVLGLIGAALLMFFFVAVLPGLTQEMIQRERLYPNVSSIPSFGQNLSPEQGLSPQTVPANSQ